MPTEFPKTFKDGLARQWTVSLSLASATRLQALTGKRLDDFIPKASDTGERLHPFRDFISDPFAVFDVFYALVKPDADALSLSKEQVLEGFSTGEAEESMAYAVLQAIVDFFRRPDPARAMMLKRHLDLGKQVMDRATTGVQAKMDAIDTNSIVDAAVEQIDPAKITADTIERLKKFAANTAAS